MRFNLASEKARTAGYALLAIGTIASTLVGLVYWSVQGWIMGVVLSALIPGFGLVSTVLDAFAL